MQTSFADAPPDEAPDETNPLAQFGPKATSATNTPSSLGAFTRGAVRGVIPAAGSLAGAGAGAAGGAALGELAFPPGGAIPGALIGGIAGALGLGLGGSYAAARVQNYGLSKLPDTWVDAIGQSDAQQRLDEELAPKATMLGGLAPFLLTMRPGLSAVAPLGENATPLQRLMANPVTARVISHGTSGAVMGGIELGQEAAEGKVDWTNVAIATTFGLILNKPTKLGERIEGVAPRALGAPTGAERTEDYALRDRAIKAERGLPSAEKDFWKAPDSYLEALGEYEPHHPTLKEADAYNVAGPGVTEAVHQGSQVREPTSQATANAALREEAATVGPAPPVDVDALARKEQPDAFARYDELLSERDTYSRWLEDEPGNATASHALESIDRDISAVLPDINAARRRVADKANVETVPPVPVNTEPEAVVPPSATAPVKPLAEQKAAIAADVKRQFVAAGRPEDEAEQIGTLVANRFAVRAAQFKGNLGTAEELYAREGARVQSAEPPVQPAAPTPPPGETVAARVNSILPVAKPAPAPAPRFEIPPPSETIADRVNALPEPPAPPSPIQTAPRKAPAKPPKQEAAPKITPEAARAKADRLEVSNLVDSLFHAGATAKEIEAVVGKDKMTADEIAAMAPAREAQPARVKGPAELEYERIKAENAAKPLPPGVSADEAIPVENLPERLARLKAEKEAGVSLRQGEQGSYQRGTPRGVITLFTGEADASTAIHELGHDFLEQMRRDAAHAQAPLAVRADWKTVSEALRLTEDGKPIKTSAHEQFARWFEQYLYEGVAPSKELAGVFARFKNWLLNIYKTVSDIFTRRQIPMSENIRQIFDRLLAEEPNRTVIAPESVRQPALPDIHAEEAARVEGSSAAPAAERIASERAETPPPREVAHEIAPIVESIKAEREAAAGADAAGKAGHGEPGSGAVVTGGAQSGAESNGGGVGAGTGPERESGSGPSSEGGGVSGGAGSTAAGRPEPSGVARAFPLAPEPGEILTAPKRFTDKASNIRLDNVKGVEDLKNLAREIAKSNNDFIGNRRDVISDPELMQLQAVIDDRVTRKTLGEASNAEEAWAIQRIAAQAWRDMASAAKTYKQTRSDDDLLAYIEKQQRATMMQAYYSQATAEAGRALRAMKKVQEFWSPGGEAAKAVTEGAAPKPKPGDIVQQATGRTLWQKAQEALLVAEYEDPQSVARFNTWTRRHSFGRMLLEYWINGLLSGTATHTTYVIGNTLLSLEKAMLETPVAAGIGALRPIMGREGGNVVRFGEAAARFRAIGSGYAPAVQASMEALRTGRGGLLPGETSSRRLPFQPEGAPPLAGAPLNEAATMHDAKIALYGATRGILDGMVSIGKILQAAPEGSPAFSVQWSPQGAIPDFQVRGGTLPVGQLARAPSRVIASIHTFFRAMNYSMDKNAEIYRQASTEGEAGNWSQDRVVARMAQLTNVTPEDIVERSRQQASEATLMGPAAEFMRKLQAWLSWAPNIPGLGETPVLKFIDPFVHIASNVIDQTFIKRTPVGWLSSELRRDLLGGNGVAAQDMAQARMIVGTALSLGFGALAANGYVTGSGPSDRGKRAVWVLAGYQPHSVRIGDTWFQMNRLGPLGMLLGTAADLYDVAHAARQYDLLGAAALLQHAITQNVLDESFMRGPADLIQAVEDPGRYGERYIQNFASSFVPASVGLAQMDRASDPYSRQARTVMDAIKQKVPGLSETLLPSIDIWGQPIPNHDALISAGLTAIYESRMSSDPVNIALADAGIGIAPVDRTIRNVKLTDQQYDDFARIAGRMTKQRLDVYVNSPNWQHWSVGARADAVRTIVQGCREAAIGWMFGKYPSILADSTRIKAQKHGVSQ